VRADGHTARAGTNGKTRLDVLLGELAQLGKDLFTSAWRGSTSGLTVRSAASGQVSFRGNPDQEVVLGVRGDHTDVEQPFRTSRRRFVIVVHHP
jgi:hypothetical protein